jgi:hypothetical protein
MTERTTKDNGIATQNFNRNEKHEINPATIGRYDVAGHT